ncbi:MAG TPA: hypothetical protein VEK38_03010 [Candidatus Bathyarchaeia archaeon]|nr:hypothetical protein [Candidatus Bathyarchaeia archaeon]
MKNISFLLLCSSFVFCAMASELEKSLPYRHMMALSESLKKAGEFLECVKDGNVEKCEEIIQERGYLVNKQVDGDFPPVYWAMKSFKILKYAEKQYKKIIDMMINHEEFNPRSNCIMNRNHDLEGPLDWALDAELFDTLLPLLRKKEWYSIHSYDFLQKAQPLMDQFSPQVRTILAEKIRREQIMVCTE